MFIGALTYCSKPGQVSVSRFLSLFAAGLVCALLVTCTQKARETDNSQNAPTGQQSETVAAIEETANSQGNIDADSSSNIEIMDQPMVNSRVPHSTVINQNSAKQRAVQEIVATGSYIRKQHASSDSAVRARSQGLTFYQPDPDIYYPGTLPNNENYLELVENSVKRVIENPMSTFSIDVDTAAYSNLRRMLSREGRLPPHDAVRLEEMINYFNYDYETPDSLKQPLSINTELISSPWNPANKLLMVGIKGFEPEPAQRPAANLVFLVDVSGSMQSMDKLGLVKKSLHLLVSQMNENDRIALVVYAGAAGMVLDSTPGDQKATILNAIDSLTAGGSTNGGAGIELAYRIAEQHTIEGGINRIIIASDGDMNVGITSIASLKELVSKKSKKGIALTTLGFGSGNYNYSLLEQLADIGDGNAAYIDSLSEARKVLIEELQSTLLTIAKDVKIQIEFNPDVVAEYRLLGYENRLLKREDFRNDKIDAGEIGAGHTVTALYEISLVGSAGSVIPDSRYRSLTEPIKVDLNDELAYVKLRYKLPEETASVEFGLAVLQQADNMDNNEASENIRFAAAVAGFGQLLQGGKYTQDWGYDELLQLARQSRGSDDHGYRSEMVKLVELAQVL